MNNAEKVSVVIPTYNRPVDVARAVRSALAQTHRPYQILVVDDGSTDNTGDVIRSMPPPVTYLNKENSGVSSARNLGLQYVTGDYICLCDSDDYWDPGWIKSAVNAIEGTPGAGAAVCTTLAMVAPDGREIGTVVRDISSNGVVDLPKLFLGGITGSNLCMRADILKAVGGYDTTLRTAEDIDFALRISAVTTIVAISQPLVYITQSSGSLSKYLNTGNRLRVFSKFESTFPTLAHRYRNALLDAKVETTLSYARDLIVARQFANAHARLSESWAYRPTTQAAILWTKILILKLITRAKPSG